KDSAGWQVLFSSLEQNAIGIPARNVIKEGDSINFILQSDRYSYSFKNSLFPDEYSLTGTLKVDTLEVDYVLVKNIKRVNQIERQEITFDSNGLQLGGTIWRPRQPNRRALVFITSSGGADRSGSRAEAMYFAQRGYTTFHYDKRGTGVSEGNWHSADMDDLCSDDINAIRYFSNQVKIPISQIGIKGSSQGGAKVPYILNEIQELKFGISVSCPGSTLLESDLNFWKNRNVQALGNDLESASWLQKQVFEHIAGKISREDLEKSIEEKKLQPWFSSVWVPNLDEVNFDKKLLFSPLPHFEQVKQAVLIIQGTSDEIIPVNSHSLISLALEIAENKNFKVIKLEQANHSMYHTGKSDFPYWAKLHKDYLNSMESWIDGIQ
ncbi:MAG: prolyl oligopeptidase family serine peptidase, partial [Eudoraea sp.]|nr:prolyl oligopeptidase family serine peptidase [Eudoraea sp.]